MRADPQVQSSDPLGLRRCRDAPVAWHHAKQQHMLAQSAKVQGDLKHRFITLARPEVQNPPCRAWGSTFSG